MSTAAIQELYQRGVSLFNDFSITKDDGVTSVAAGAAVTYTMVVSSNGGFDTAVGTTVSDLFSSSLTGVTYTATQVGGASGFTANGSGAINDTVTLPVGSSITYVITSMVGVDASGTLTNTATLTPPPGFTDPIPGDQTAIDSDTVTPLVAASYLAPDPGDPTKTALFVVGTALDDKIVVKKVAGGVRVLQGGISQGNFSPTGSILVFGAAGNDKITVDTRVTKGALLDGGDGNDTLLGGNGHDILIGGDGGDVLKGRGRRNIFIGGITVPAIDLLVDLSDAREAWGAKQVPATLNFTDLIDDGIIDLLFALVARSGVYRPDVLVNINRHSCVTSRRLAVSRSLAQRYDYRTASERETAKRR